MELKISNPNILCQSQTLTLRYICHDNTAAIQITY